MLEKEKLAEKLKLLKEEGSLLKKEFQGHLVANVVTALGVVAALAWNDAIQAGIKYFFQSSNDTLQAKISYAFVITLVAVVASVYLTRWFKRS